jgi:hypothetical protein
MAILNIKRGDTRTAIKATLKNPKGLPINLTGATVKFVMVKYKTILINREAVILDAVNGVVAFTFNSGETDQMGRMRAEFKVKYPDNSIETFPNQGSIDINIESDLSLGG